MAFWGVEVKPGKPFTLKPNESTGIRRLHLSQATLGLVNATNRSILQCNVGNKSPLFLCVLTPEKVDSCQLNLEFEESEDVIFSVIGPRSIHITGYFLGRSNTSKLNDDESESFGEDIVDTDVEKGSSDDYDYSDSFINDDDPGHGSNVSSTDDDEISIKEFRAKTKEKKGRRLRKKKYHVSDSESDETTPKDVIEVEDSDDDDLKIPIDVPSRVTRSKARSSTLENGETNDKCEKTSEGITHTLKAMDDGELSPVGKDGESSSKKKKKKDKSKSLVEAKTEEVNLPEGIQKEEINGDASISKKKRKRDKKGEEVASECSKSKKQAIDNKNIDKEGKNKKPVETEVSTKGVIIEEIKKGNVDGKSAVKGKKVSILYTGKVKETGKVFDSNLGEDPLKFRLGGDKVIEGLNIGVEGMRVGDKRRLVIPPSLGYSKEGSKEKDVPKNAWLVYEVEAVKTR